MSTLRKVPVIPHAIPNHIATLDLHGLTKSEGLVRATKFFDQISSAQRKNGKGDAWVLVITGSGAHSPDGPVLRGAIKSMIKKRRMNHKLMNGKGSFLIDAMSGFVFYDPEQPRDSKVLVISELNSNDLYDKEMCVGKSDYIAGPSKFPLNKPLPLMKKSPSKSFGNESFKKAFSRQTNEDRAIRRAMSESLLEKKRETEEEEEYEKAIEMSCHDFFFCDRRRERTDTKAMRIVKIRV